MTHSNVQIMKLFNKIVITKEGDKMTNSYHSETQSSQRTCLQRKRMGACIFSWRIAHISLAAAAGSQVQ